MKRQRNSFLTPLVVEVMPSGKRFKVAREFTYISNRLHIKIYIAPDFETDFASVPRLCRIIIPKLGKYTKAAVLHDFLYSKAGGPIKRSTADLLFRDGMRELGVKPWKYWLMWAGVRIGGWLSWRKREVDGDAKWIDSRKY